MSAHFTIIIPTKNRLSTLKYTIKSCLEQDYNDLTVVVAENNCSDGTREFLAKDYKGLVTVVPSDETLTLCNNWDRVVKEFLEKNTYIFFLGDDDGLVPGSLRLANKLIEDFDCSVLSWKKIEYVWPCSKLDTYRNYIKIPLSNVIVKTSGDDFLDAGHSFKVPYNEGPCIYNSFVHSSILSKIFQSDGSRIFRSFCPDVYSSYTISAYIDFFYRCNFAFSINGASGLSNGINYIFQHGSEASTRFQEENPTHLGITHAPSVAIAEADALLNARDAHKDKFKKFYLHWERLLERLVFDMKHAISPSGQLKLLNAIKYIMETNKVTYDVPTGTLMKAIDKLAPPAYGFDAKNHVLSSNLEKMELFDVYGAALFADAVNSLKNIDVKLIDTQQKSDDCPKENHSTPCSLRRWICDFLGVKLK